MSSILSRCTLYFSSTLLTSPFLTSIGYASFEFCIMLGQLLSDWIITQFGPRNVMVASGILATSGMFIVVLAPSMPSYLGVPLNLQSCDVSWYCTEFGVIGYAITGMGLSSVGPVLISSAGKLHIMNASPSLALGVLTGGSYIGMLLGPVIFGELSMLLGQLRWALLIDASLMVGIPLLSLYAFDSTDGNDHHIPVFHSVSAENVEELELVHLPRDRIQSHSSRESNHSADGGYSFTAVASDAPEL